MDDFLLVGCFIQDLQAGDRRVEALRALNEWAQQSLRKSATYPGEKAVLAPLLWSSFGTVSILLGEVVHVYPQLARPAALTAAAIARANNALGVLYYMTQHSDTCHSLLSAGMPQVLYPCLNEFGDYRLEILRTRALSIIAAMLSRNHEAATEQLLGTEIIPLCLKNLETRRWSSLLFSLFLKATSDWQFFLYALQLVCELRNMAANLADG